MEVSKKDDLDLGLYFKIIDSYEQTLNDEEKAIVEKNKLLIEIINYCQNNNKFEMLGSMLVFIINLYGDNIPGDIYDKTGKDFTQLKKREKRKLKDLLKQEILR